MGKLRNFISQITVHKDDRDSFIENEIKYMGPGEMPKEEDEPKQSGK